MKKVAIFDIDGTIFRSSLLIEVTEGLLQAGIFPKKISKTYQASFTKWLSRQGSYEKYIMDVVYAFQKNIKGVSRKDFTAISKQVVDFHKNRVYRYTRDLVKKLKKKGYYLLAISHSPKELADQFCKNLGFNKVYGRVYEVSAQGKFTGNTLYADLIDDKAKILKRAVEKERLTLSHSVGVGDTESDIAFLSIVAHPICFNPNNKLYQHAKKSGWRVVVERKDVIYKL